MVGILAFDLPMTPRVETRDGKRWIIFYVEDSFDRVLEELQGQVTEIEERFARQLWADDSFERTLRLLPTGALEVTSS